MVWKWENIDWSATAAWVQALGSIGAIVGTAAVALRQSREAIERERRDHLHDQRDRWEAEAAALLAASRLVSIGRTKVEVLAQRLEEDVEHLNSSHVGIPTRANHRAALRRLEAFPITALKSADAVMLYCRALEVMELVMTLLEECANLCSAHPRLTDEIIAQQVSPLRKLAAEIVEIDEVLRETAEPRWRDRLAAKVYATG